MASALLDFPSRSKRTRSSNSNGKVEAKIAQSGAANSTVTDSCSVALPERTALTRTRKLTGRAWGKNRANSSTQSCVVCPSTTPARPDAEAVALPPNWPDRLTSPLGCVGRSAVRYRGYTRRPTNSQRQKCTWDAKGMRLRFRDEGVERAGFKLRMTATNLVRVSR